MAPVNVENKPKLKPFARIGVGNTSATQMNAGASKHYIRIKISLGIDDGCASYLEEYNV